MTKSTGDKSLTLSPHSPVKLNARNLLALLSDGQLSDVQPQSWKSIISALGVKAPHEIKRARQLLKGLIRQGEITELDGRHYVLAKSTATKQRSHEAAAPQLSESESLNAYGQGKARDEAQDELQGGVKGYGGMYNRSRPLLRTPGFHHNRRYAPAAGSRNHRGDLVHPALQKAH